MADSKELAEQREETRLIIEELLEDGSDPDALYAIEHHISCENFETLEKAAVEVFKLGYEVTEPEEIEIESGEILVCFDAVSESGLNAELIDAQVEQLMNLAEKWVSITTAGELILKIPTLSTMTKMAKMKMTKASLISHHACTNCWRYMLSQCTSL